MTPYNLISNYVLRSTSLRAVRVDFKHLSESTIIRPRKSSYSRDGALFEEITDVITIEIIFLVVVGAMRAYVLSDIFITAFIANRSRITS